MAKAKPNKPASTLPDNWGGIKTPYTESQVTDGYSESIPTIIDGGNLNYEKNGVFENIDYVKKTADVINDIPPGKMLGVDSNNKFDYVSPAVIATDEEYNVGTETGKTPNVKQVKDSLKGVITEQRVDEKIESATKDLQPKLPKIEEGQILVSDGENFYGEDQMAGIPLSNITNQQIKKTSNSVSLNWQDPRDTIIDGYVLSSWKSTTIVKKQGSYPENVKDGTVVEIVTDRNKYLDTPLVDTQANATNWYYRAFPLSVNGVYSLDKRNSFGVVLFGYRINEVDPVPSTRVEYLPFTDNAFYDPCVMDFVSDTFNWGSWRKAFFIPKPCALKYNGTVDYYLNPDNFTLKEGGGASDVANSAYAGNFMCEFPAIFVKVYKENNYINVLFSNIKLDDGYECWSCKKADGSYSPNFYLPMFEGTNIDNKLRSIATNGRPTGSTNAETEATLATANGSGWNTTLWADEVLMMLLYPLLFKSTDSQSTLGAGAPGSTSGLTCNNDAAVTRGLMYGTKDRAAPGLTFLGLHNWHGHRWRRPNGLMNDKGNIKVKMTHSTIDGSTVTGFNRTGNGYISTGFVPPAANQSYINRYEPLGGGKYGIVPKAVTGSSATFYCDGMWTNNGQLDQLIMCGSVSNGAISGAFCFAVDNLPTHSYWDSGASPSYRRL